MGRLDSKQEATSVVSRRALSQCLRGTKANPAFGMGFWNNRAAGPGAREFDIEDMLERDWWKQEWHSTCLSREAPTDMIASVGSGYPAAHRDSLNGAHHRATGEGCKVLRWRFFCGSCWDVGRRRCPALHLDVSKLVEQLPVAVQ